MIIGIDASWACGKRTGTGILTLNLVKSLVASDRKNTYVLYFRNCCQRSNPLYQISERNVIKRVVDCPSTIVRVLIPLSLAIRTDKVDVFLSPAFFLPLFGSKRWVVNFFDFSIYTIPKEWKRRESRVGFVLMRLLFPLSLRKAHHIIAISDATRTDMVRLFPFTSHKSSVIYPALITERFKVRQKPAIGEIPGIGQLPYLLFVGALSPRKNLERCIRAFAQFTKEQRKKFNFVLAGQDFGGHLQRTLKPLVKQLNLEDRVLFCDFVTDNELIRLYTNAHCLVFPSLYEGFGYPILEAMYFGVPVITSTISSCPEVAGDAALYVNPRSETEIAEAMLKITSDEVLHRDLIEKGRARCKVFLPDHTAPQYLSLLETITA